MSTNLIPVKTFLGKYYPDLNYSTVQEKYKDTGLNTFFEQRFYIQNNDVQMMVDSSLSGLVVIISGNEIHISKEFYDHPNVVISNSLENPDSKNNPRSLYYPEVFSTVAYLICQNHTMFQIVGEINEPIYIRYTSDYETFYNSVVVFEITNDISVEIVEEIASVSALNSVTNYILHSGSNVKLTTFYQNHISGISFVFRNIITQDTASFKHLLFGKGSSNVIDENKIMAYPGSNLELLGIVNPNNGNFHSILTLLPIGDDYSMNIDYRNIISGKGKASFFPSVTGPHLSEKVQISVSNIMLDDMPADSIDIEIKKYLNDITQKAILDRIVGIKRFYDNKTKFLHFP